MGGVVKVRKKLVIVVVFLLFVLLVIHILYIVDERRVLEDFRNRVVGLGLLDELVPRYSGKRVLVNELMTIEEVFLRLSGDGARVEWSLSPFFRMVNGKYYGKIYEVRVEVTRSCLFLRRVPEVKRYRASFLFDVRDRKVRRLYSGSSDEGIGFEVLDCVDDEERYWK